MMIQLILRTPRVSQHHQLVRHRLLGARIQLHWLRPSRFYVWRWTWTMWTCLFLLWLLNHGHKSNRATVLYDCHLNVLLTWLQALTIALGQLQQNSWNEVGPGQTSSFSVLVQVTLGSQNIVLIFLVSWKVEASCCYIFWAKLVVPTFRVVPFLKVPDPSPHLWGRWGGIGGEHPDTGAWGHIGHTFSTETISGINGASLEKMVVRPQKLALDFLWEERDDFSILKALICDPNHHQLGCWWVLQSLFMIFMHP